MKRFKVINVVVLAWLLCAVMIAGCGVGSAPSSAPAQGDGQLTIRMLDIGQGDSTLIKAGGEIVLIDTGDVEMRDRLVELLKKEGVETIDKLIISHPHADHLGGAYAALKSFKVKSVYDNGQAAATNTYRTYMKLIKQQNIPYKQLAEGDRIELGGGVEFKVFHPDSSNIKGSEDLNNNSIVGKLTYRKFSMLFTGDSEAEAEKAMLAKYGKELKSTLLKSPHHGSKTSSNRNYLKAVAPEAALIPVGKDNDYKHPHAVTINKYKDLGIKIYRTDQDGAITVKTDGTTYEITKER